MSNNPDKLAARRRHRYITGLPCPAISRIVPLSSDGHSMHQGAPNTGKE